MSAALETRDESLAVDTRQLVRQFGEHPALNGLDLKIRRGEFVALLGKSGSGKTTLLRLLAGLDTPDSGELLVPRSRTVVFQEPRLINSKRVWQNVALGLERSSATRAAAIGALEEVGLERHNESRSRVHWCANPSCCCSMSPSPRWTR